MKTQLIALYCAAMLPAFVQCMPQQQQAPAEAPAPPPPPYEPNFKYAAGASGQKLDVNLGIVSPQFSTGSQLYQQANRTDTVVRNMLSSMQATFNEVLIAKGFSTTGPFGSLEEMTFPDKQGADLVLYPEFDFQVELKFENMRDKPVQSAAPADGAGPGFSLDDLVKTNEPKAAGTTPVPTTKVCDVTLTVFGNMMFVAQEPLSKQRMWFKKLDVTAATQTFNGQEGEVCDGKPEHWTRDVKDAWAKAHEAIFQTGMKAFDNYVTGEEFQRLKAQSVEAREKTNFGG